jgi:hypothetical protein
VKLSQKRQAHAAIVIAIIGPFPGIAATIEWANNRSGKLTELHRSFAAGAQIVAQHIRAPSPRFSWPHSAGKRAS